MAFTIQIQYNASEDIALTKDLTTIAELSGVLRQETSIIEPVILIEGDLTDFTGANYMTIPAFERSYFINNIRSIRNDLIEISARVDVLYSFRAYIRENKAIIRKSVDNWNLYLNDGTFTVSQKPEILTLPFPIQFAYNTKNFVLAIAGN